MEVKLLLTKAISLVYYRSHTNNTSSVALDTLLSQVLDHINLPEDAGDGNNRERGYLNKLRSLLLWMTRNGSDYKYDLNELMVRIRVACGDNDRLYELFLKNLLLTDEEQAGKRVSEISSELLQFVSLEEFSTILRKASRDLGFNKEGIADVSTWRADLISRIEALPIEGRRKLSKNARIVDMNDIESVAQIFEAAQTRIDPTMILKFPYVGLNDFTGPQQGLLRGDWSVHCALPGQNKTGVLLDTFAGWAVLNKPTLRDANKTPALVYVTIEDPIETVMQKFYTILKQIDTGLPVKVVGVPYPEMAQFVNERFTANGWRVFIMSFPNGGHSDEYIQIFKDMEDQGYEVAGVCCDYVNLIGKSGIPAVVAGDEIKYLHRKLRGYFNPRLITHCTVHQLSTKAKEMFRIDSVDYVRKLPNQGSFEGCASLDTEPDFIFYVAKTQHGKGAWYQQFQFDKHRRIGTLPDHLKYFAMRFQNYPMMNCPWDVLADKPAAYDKIGALKAKPVANWDTLAEINADAANGHDSDDDLDF